MQVFIATPSYDGKMEARYTAALIDTINLLRKRGHTSIWYSNKGALLCRARNECVHQFLETTSGQLIFIDSDIIWKPEDLLKLVESPHKIVGGNYLRKGFNIFAVDEIKAKVDEDIALVEALPTGFLKIDREVFETLKTFYNLKPYNKEGCLPFFQVQYSEGSMLSEDVRFCKQWNGTGGKCYADLSICLKHIGESTFEGCPKVHFSKDTRSKAAEALKVFKEKTWALEQMIKENMNVK